MRQMGSEVHGVLPGAAADFEYAAIGRKERAERF
jgi:hypothetical protein